MTLIPIPGDGKRAQDVTGEMADAIRALIYEFAGKHTIPLASTLGVLEIVKMQLVRDHE